VIAPYDAITHRFFLLHREIESYQRIRGPIKQTSRESVMLGHRQPLPVIARFDSNVRSRTGFKIPHEAGFLLFPSPTLTSIFCKFLPINFWRKLPTQFPVPTENPTSFRTLRPRFEHLLKIISQSSLYWEVHTLHRRRVARKALFTFHEKDLLALHPTEGQAWSGPRNLIGETLSFPAFVIIFVIILAVFIRTICLHSCIASQGVCVVGRDISPFSRV
jgi:hypothetical protein